MEAFLGQKRAATPAEPSAALRAFFEVTSPAGTTAPSQQQGKCKGCGHQITMRSDRISHFAPNKTGAGSWSKYKMYRICSENMAEKNWRFGFQLYGQALPCQGCQDRQLVLDSLSRGSNPVNRHLCVKVGVHAVFGSIMGPDYYGMAMAPVLLIAFLWKRK